MMSEISDADALLAWTEERTEATIAAARRIRTTLNYVLTNVVGDSTGLGFFGVTPVARPAAITQTYATASSTHANLTSATLTDSTTGTADAIVADVGGAFNQATLNNNFADLTAQINALRVDLVNAKGVLNDVIDKLQSLGLLQ